MTVSVDVKSFLTDWDSGICLRPLASKYGMSAATAMKMLNGVGVDTSRRSCFSDKTWKLIQASNTILNESETRMTVRQIFYQLAVRNYVPLSKAGYDAAKLVLTKGRRGNYIPWDKIEDRTRLPHTPTMWTDKNDFYETVKTAYRRNIWTNQPSYFEVWLEKNALYGIVAPVVHKYGVTLQPITGYSSISAIYDGANRMKDGDTVLYFGDHDATGIDIDKKLINDFIKDHGKNINVKRIGLLYEDIEKYNLPKNIEKEKDTRLKEYKSRGYTKQAELDALPTKVLVKRIEDAIVSHLDMKAYQECRNVQKEELNEIQSRLSDV